MSKLPQHAKLTRDHELLVIGKVFDLIATLHPERREFVVDYVRGRLGDMPVIGKVEGNAKGEEEGPLMFPPHDQRHPQSLP